MVVDLHYYARLIYNKIKYSKEFKAKWTTIINYSSPVMALQAIDDIFEPILNIKRLVDIRSIMLLSEPFDTLTGFEKDIYRLFSGLISFNLHSIDTDMVSTLYSLAIMDKQKYIILSDDTKYWAICSKKSKIAYCVISKNNRPKFYSDKFGLEYLSSLIQTNKLVNKLRLSKLKYVNLQYLYLLLLYVKFKQVKADQTFDLSEKRFLGSSGKALKLLSDAHREISYYFLTKSDMMDIFLTSSTTHFTLNLSRLLKITPFDLVLMGKFAAYYNSVAIRQVPVEKAVSSIIYYKAVENSKALLYQRINKTKVEKKSLPDKPLEVDISLLETSMAVDQILKGLSW